MRRPAPRRARDAAAKDERRAAIVEAAADLFADTPYERLTMAAVADRCGLAKGTVYLYFETKEALFLAVLSRHVERWFGELLVALPGAEAAAIPGLLAGTLVARPALLRLLARLHHTLEQNLADAVAERFKVELRAAMMEVGGALEARIPAFRPGDGVRFLLYVHALVVGLHQMASPGPAVQAVLDRPEMAGLRIDVERDLGRALSALIAGWQAGG